MAPESNRLPSPTKNAVFAAISVIAKGVLAIERQVDIVPGLF